MAGRAGGGGGRFETKTRLNAYCTKQHPVQNSRSETSFKYPLTQAACHNRNRVGEGRSQTCLGHTRAVKNTQESSIYLRHVQTTTKTSCLYAHVYRYCTTTQQPMFAIVAGGRLLTFSSSSSCEHVFLIPSRKREGRKKEEEKCLSGRKCISSEHKKVKTFKGRLDCQS